MRDARDRPRLAREDLEKLLPRALAEIRRSLQHLHGDRAIERHLAGAVDEAEAPLGDGAVDDEASVERGPREAKHVGLVVAIRAHGRPMTSEPPGEGNALNG